MLLGNIVSYITSTITFAGTKLVDLANAIGTAGVEVAKKILLID